MAFISISEHEKFIRLFHTSIPVPEVRPPIEAEQRHPAIDENTELIKADINQLQTLLEEYKRTVSHLQGISEQYKVTMQRAKANMRKHHVKLSRQHSKLFRIRP